MPISDNHSNDQHFGKKTDSDSEVSQDNDLAISELYNLDEKWMPEPCNSPSIVPDVNVHVTFQTSREELLVHKNKLEQFCTLCGDSTAALPGRTPTGKDLFPKEIQDIYFIDVKQDNEYIHPPYICFSKCKSKLLRYQRQKKRQQHHLAGGSSSGGLPKDRTAVAWKSHGSDDKYGSCNVCQLRRSSRKKVISDHDHCYFVGASKKTCV